MGIIGKGNIDKFNGHVPSVHWDRIKKIDKEFVYVAEITDAAGTHEIYLNKEKVDNNKILIRNYTDRPINKTEENKNGKKKSTKSSKKTNR